MKYTLLFLLICTGCSTVYDNEVSIEHYEMLGKYFDNPYFPKAYYQGCISDNIVTYEEYNQIRSMMITSEKEETKKRLPLWPVQNSHQF